MAETAKRPRGRPRTGFDKKAYVGEYHRKKRAEARAIRQYLSKGETK